MLENDFDKFMKENLESAKMGWDKEAMWNDIEPELEPAKKSKKPFFIYLLMGTFVIIAAASFYFINTSETKIENSIDNKAQVATELKTNNKATSTNINEEIIITSVIIDETPQPIINSKADNSFAVPTASESLLNDQVVNNSKSQFVQTSSENSSLLNADPQDKFNFEKPLTSINSASPFKMEKTVTVPQEDQEDVAKLEPRNLLLSSLPELGLIPIYHFENQNDYQDLSLNLSKIKPLKMNKSLGSRIRAGFYTSYFLINKELSALANASNITFRNNSETPLEGLSAGLNFEYDLSKNLYLNVGLDYLNITESLDYLEDRIIENTVTSDSAFYFSKPDGSVSYISGESTSSRRTVNQYRLYNQYTNLSLPILLGFKTEISNKIGAALYAGPSLNLYQNFRGSYVDEEGVVMPITDINNQNIFNDFQLGLNLSWKIKSRTSLCGGLNFRKSLNSISIDQLNEQSYDLFGIKLGFLYTI